MIYTEGRLDNPAGLLSAPMQSDQETLVRLISERSVGAPLVFVPEKIRKGSGLREPADLVWVCDGAVLLFYLCRKQMTSDVRKQMKRRNEAISHNLEQARGWLRTWRHGRRLCGKNRSCSYELTYGDKRHVVIISVIACDQDLDEYHHTETLNLGVSMCATVSQQTADTLARSRASAIDYLEYFDILRTYDRHDCGIASKPSEPLLLWRERNAPAVTRPNPGFDQELTTRLHQYIMGMRTSPVQGGSSDPSMLFNDIPLFDYLRIVHGLRECVERVGPEHRMCAVMRIMLRSGPAILAAAGSHNLNQLHTTMDALTNDALAQRKSGYPLHITYETVMGVPVIAFKRRTGRSNTEILLDRVAWEQYCHPGLAAIRHAKRSVV